MSVSILSYGKGSKLWNILEGTPANLVSEPICEGKGAVVFLLITHGRTPCRRVVQMESVRDLEYGLRKVQGALLGKPQECRMDGRKRRRCGAGDSKIEILVALGVARIATVGIEVVGILEFG